MPSLPEKVIRHIQNLKLCDCSLSQLQKAKLIKAALLSIFRQLSENYYKLEIDRLLKKLADSINHCLVAADAS